MSDKVILSEYHGHKETASRSATVIKEKQGLAVELYEFEHMVEKRPLHSHSEQYAENAAENYVMGVFDVKDRTKV
jgi:hypothetical protein